MCSTKWLMPFRRALSCRLPVRTNTLTLTVSTCGKPIVTTLETDKTFYPAEDYHQDFLTLNPTYPYIVFNDLPKVANLKQLFPTLYSEKPVLVLAASKS